MSRAAIAHLRREPEMAARIKRAGPYSLKPTQRSPYESLLRAIAHQQLHGRASEAILARFRALFPDVPFPTPERVLATDDASLRATGFSAGKIAAIRDLCLRTIDGTVPTRRAAARLTDEELVARLTRVRGIGRWTVEMLLIFTLGRPDVLPVDDYGVRDGYRALMRLPEPPRPRELAAIGEAWAPWRSYAAWYLWRAAEEAKKQGPQSRA
jgi:DNA-3-methyladenine glycosylase II